MTNLDRIRKTLSPARRRRIDARAAALIVDEQSLQNLRRAHGMTQTAMAQALGIGQDGVSRLEQRRDMRLSTLRGYVEALGGQLSVVANFPGQPPVVLSGGARAVRGILTRTVSTDRVIADMRGSGPASAKRRK